MQRFCPRFYGSCSHLFQSRGVKGFKQSKTRSELQLIKAVNTMVSGDSAKCVHLILCTQANLFTHAKFQLNEPFIHFFSSKSDTTFTLQQMQPDGYEDSEDPSWCQINKSDLTPKKKKHAVMMSWLKVTRNLDSWTMWRRCGFWWEALTSGFLASQTHLHIFFHLLLLVTQLAKGIDDQAWKRLQPRLCWWAECVWAKRSPEINTETHPEWWPARLRWQKRKMWCQRRCAPPQTHLQRGPRSHHRCRRQHARQRTCGTCSTKRRFFINHTAYRGWGFCSRGIFSLLTSLRKFSG